MRKLLNALLMLLIAGAASACTTTTDNIMRAAYFSAYGEGHPVTVQDGLYTVFDKPSEQWMMVKSSLETTLRRGPFAPFDESGYLAPFRAAAAKYLQERRRSCTISSGSIMVRPYVEFTYRCEQRS